VPIISAAQGRATTAGSLRPPQLDPRQLTGHLGHARDLQELLSLHQRHGDDFNGFHIGAFWSKFKALARGRLGGLSVRLAPVCEQTARMLPELNARAVANVVHAFAKAELVGAGPWESVWAALPEVVRRRLGMYDPQHLSNTAWAFAKAGHASHELFNAISAEAVRRRLGGFNAQDLSNTAWAFATAGHEAPELFNAISAEAVGRRLGGFNEQDLSNTAWAFATAGHASHELFNAISAEEVRRGLRGFNEQELSNTAWAFATAGHASPELFAAISAEVVRRRLGGFNEMDLSTIVWAFAAFDFPSADELFGTSSFTSRCAHFEASFSAENLRQLYQWSLWREERSGRGAMWPELPDSLRQACRNAFVEEDAQPSQLQSDVVREIRSHDVEHVEEEHRCEASGYSIDALLTLNDGKQIAVEVDGPFHFVGRSHLPNGATVLKHRQLRHFGWRLESVKYWEWDISKVLPWLPRRSQ